MERYLKALARVDAAVNVMTSPLVTKPLQATASCAPTQARRSSAPFPAASAPEKQAHSTNSVAANTAATLGGVSVGDEKKLTATLRELEEAKEQNRKLESVAAQKSKDISKLEAEAAKLQQENQRLQTQERESSAQLATQASNSKQQEDAITALRTENSELQRRLDEQTSQLAEYLSNDGRREGDAAEKEAELRRQVQDAASANQQLEEQLQMTTSQLQTLQSELSTAKEELHALQAKNNVLEQVGASREEAVAELKSVEDKLKAAESRLQEALSHAATERQQLLDEIAALKAAATEKDEELGAATSTADELRRTCEDRLRQLDANDEEHKSAISAMQQQLNTAQTAANQLASLQAELKSALEANAELERDVQARGQEISDMQAKLDSSVLARDAAVAASEDAQSKFRIVEAELAASKADQEHTGSAVDSVRSAFEAEISSLREQLAKAQDEERRIKIDSQAELQELRKSIQQLQESLAKQTADVERTSEQHAIAVEARMAQEQLLSKQRDDLVTQLTAANDRIAQLTDAVAAAQSADAAYEQRVNELSSASVEAEARAAAASTELKAALDDKEVMQTKFDALQREYAEFVEREQAASMTTAGKLGVLQEQLDAKTTEAATAQAAVEDLQKKVLSFENTVAVLHEDHAKIDAQLQQATTQLADALQSLAKKDAEMMKAQEELQEIRSQIQQDGERLATQLAEAQASLKDSDSKVATLQNEIDAQREQFVFENSEAARRLREKDDQLLAANTTLQNNEQLLASVRAEMLDATARKEHLEAQLKSVEGTAASLETQLQSLSAEKASLEGELCALRGELRDQVDGRNAQESLILQKAAEIEALQQEMTKLRTEISENSDRIEALIVELETCQAELSAARESVLEGVSRQAELEKDAEKLSEERSALEARVTNLEASVTDRDATIDGLRGQIAKLLDDAHRQTKLMQQRDDEHRTRDLENTARVTQLEVDAANLQTSLESTRKELSDSQTNSETLQKKLALVVKEIKNSRNSREADESARQTAIAQANEARIGLEKTKIKLKRAEENLLETSKARDDAAEKLAFYLEELRSVRTTLGEALASRKNLEEKLAAAERTAAEKIKNEARVKAMEVSPWEERDASGPSPGELMDSPIIVDVLRMLTNDEAKIKEILAWLQAAEAGDYSRLKPPHLELSNVPLPAQMGIITMVMPMLKRKKDMRFRLYARDKYEIHTDMRIMVEDMRGTLPPASTKDKVPMWRGTG